MSICDGRPFARAAAAAVVAVCVLPPSTMAAGSCPNVPFGGGETMEYFVTTRDTGADAFDGSVLPTWTGLDLNGHATAGGGCEWYCADCIRCQCACCLCQTELRTVNHYDVTLAAASQGGLNGTYSAGYVVGKDPATGATVYYQALDSRDHERSCCASTTTLSAAGSYSFTFRNVINTTECHIDPPTVSASVTVYALEPVNDDCNARVGKGAGLSSRTVATSEADWSIGSAAPVEFVRYYDSYTAGKMARGFGTWGHSFDARLVGMPGGLHKLTEPDGSLKLYRDVGGSGAAPAVAPRGEHSFLTVLADGTVTRTWPTGARDQFNAAGYLVSTTDRNGNTTSLTRDGSNRLTRLTTPFGKAVLFENDASNRVTAVSLPDSTRITYSYSGSILQKVTYADGTSRAYEHLGPGYQYLTAVKNEKGQYVRRYAYDSYGRVTQSSADGVNEKVTITATDSRHASATDTLGRVTTYTIATEGGRNRATGISRSCGQCSQGSVSNVYDADLNLVSRTDAVGNVTRYSYDARGNALSRTDGFGSLDERTTRFTYDALGDVETVLDGEGSLYSYAYDGRGNLLAIADPLGYGASYAYDARGRVTSATAASGHVTSFGWDDSGNLAWLTNPLGHTTSYTHDDMGRLLTATFAGRTTSYGYDARGRLSTVTAADGGLTTYEHDASGDLKAVTDALDNRISRDYDGIGRLTKITDPSGNTQSFAYDTESNLLSAVSRTSSGTVVRSVTYAYDDQHRVSRSTNADGSYTEFRYDPAGSLTSWRDENGAEAAYAYDALRRRISAVDPLGGTTTLRYDRRDSVVSTTDAIGQVRSFVYDGNGDLTWTSSLEGGERSYAFGPGRRLLHATDARGITATFVYDALGRITNVQYPDPSGDEEYVYDTCPNGVGRLCWANTSAVRITYEYDGMGRLARETRVIDDQALSVAYAYDLLGRVAVMTYPTGRTVSYAYTKDLLTAVTSGGTSLVSAIAYLPFGGVSSMTFGNGLTQSATFDQRYRVSSLVVPGVQQDGYGYDAASNVVTISDGLNPARNRSYGYDPVSRLTSGVGPWGALGYGYDAVGNRTSQVTSSGTSAYIYSGSRLQSISGARTAIFSHDANGNTVGIDARSYAYDQAQRLSAVIDGGQLVGSYTYGIDGLRVKKATAVGTTLFSHDLVGHVLAESTGGGGTPVEYVYANGVPVAQFRGADAYYYHVDHLGVPSVMTDGSQREVWRSGDLPYGDAAPTGTAVSNLRFPGQYFDAESGLHQNHFRDYQPSVGRYLEVDPLMHPFVTNLRLPGQYDERLFAAAGLSGLQGPYYNWNRWYLPGVGRYLELDPLAIKGSMNGVYSPDWYNYALGNPLTYTDPAGLCVEDACILEAAAAAALLTLAVKAASDLCAMATSCGQCKCMGVDALGRPNGPTPLGRRNDFSNKFKCDMACKAQGYVYGFCAK